MRKETKIQFLRLIQMLVLVIISFSVLYWISLSRTTENEDVKDEKVNTTVSTDRNEVVETTKTIVPNDYVPIGTYKFAINCNQEEFEIFCRVALAEGGIDGFEGVRAVMCSIRNDALYNRQANLLEELIHPNGYETVITDEEGNFITVQVPSQEIKFEDVPVEYIELAKRVLLGQEPDPTKGSVGFLPLEATTTPNVEDFAERYNLPEGSYVKIGSQIYYQEWTPEMNDISWNTSW